MSIWIIPPKGIVEPFPAPVFRVNRIGAIEQSGDLARFYLCTERRVLESPDLPSQLMLQCIVERSITELPQLICDLGKCLLPHAIAEIDTPPNGKPRLVT